MFSTLLVPPNITDSGSTPGGGVWTGTVSSDAVGFNLWTWLTGQLGTSLANYSTFNITIDSDVKIGGGLSTTYAFTTGDFTAGSTLTIINNGTIVGKGGTGGNWSLTAPTAGGDGGTAMLFTLDATLTNNGLIAGAGGGGGGGNAFGRVDGVVEYGAGGGGAGFLVGVGGNPGGTNGTLSSGGYAVQDGGNGGALGQAGSAGDAAGGAAGDAIHKNGKTVTVTNNGTITGTVSATT